MGRVTRLLPIRFVAGPTACEREILDLGRQRLVDHQRAMARCSQAEEFESDCGREFMGCGQEKKGRWKK
jgi:hypothetical protein